MYKRTYVFILFECGARRAGVLCYYMFLILGEERHFRGILVGWILRYHPAASPIDINTRGGFRTYEKTWLWVFKCNKS